MLRHQLLDDNNNTSNNNKNIRIKSGTGGVME